MTPVVMDMQDPKRHREQASRASAKEAELSARVETVAIFSRLLGDQTAMLKEVVGEYEQCGVALGQAYEELEVRDRTLRELERGLRRAESSKTLSGTRIILNDLLLMVRKR